MKKYKEIEDAKFRKLNPTVAEYASKWLTMQSAHISPTTLEGYTNAMNTYIVKVTMDIYAKVKYNKPEQLSSVVNSALKLPSSDREEEQEKN